MTPVAVERIRMGRDCLLELLCLNLELSNQWEENSLQTSLQHLQVSEQQHGYLFKSPIQPINGQQIPETKQLNAISVG